MLSLLSDASKFASTYLYLFYRGVHVLYTEIVTVYFSSFLCII